MSSTYGCDNKDHALFRKGIHGQRNKTVPIKFEEIFQNNSQ